MSIVVKEKKSLKYILSDLKNISKSMFESFKDILNESSVEDNNEIEEKLKSILEVENQIGATSTIKSLEKESTTYNIVKEKNKASKTKNAKNYNISSKNVKRENVDEEKDFDREI